MIAWILMGTMMAEMASKKVSNWTISRTLSELKTANPFMIKVRHVFHEEACRQFERGELQGDEEDIFRHTQ
jgi:hypothetical protein